MTCRTIAVIAFDGINPFHLSIPHEVFGVDRSAGGVPRFELRICAQQAGPITTAAGYALFAPHDLDGLLDAHTIIVPSWRDPGELPPQELLDALRAARQRDACLVGLCLGAFVLAAAGVLDGRPATTHWLAAEEFARRYPRIEVKPDVLYVDDGEVLTSAGVAAGIDCCLHLLRRWHGAEIASHVARRMVVPPHRQGGQAQYIEAPIPPRVDGDRLAPVLDWACQHLEQELSVDALAERATMSRRTFTRRFKQATGTTVNDWIRHQRLAMAQRLLEMTDLPIELIAVRAGFGSALSLRQLFGEVLHTSPSAYRREFRGSAA